jgi:hypothetical protein
MRTTATVLNYHGVQTTLTTVVGQEALVAQISLQFSHRRPLLKRVRRSTLLIAGWQRGHNGHSVQLDVMEESNVEQEVSCNMQSTADEDVWLQQMKYESATEMLVLVAFIQ